MFKLFKARVQGVTAGKLMSSIARLLLSRSSVVLEDAGEIKAALREPLIKIFSEFIKTNK